MGHFGPGFTASHLICKRHLFSLLDHHQARRSYHRLCEHSFQFQTSNLSPRDSQPRKQQNYTRNIVHLIELIVFSFGCVFMKLIPSLPFCEMQFRQGITSCCWCGLATIIARGDTRPSQKREAKLVWPFLDFAAAPSFAVEATRYRDYQSTKLPAGRSICRHTQLSRL